MPENPIERPVFDALLKAFTELKHSEARLQAIVDTIPSFAWRGAPDGAKEFLNQRWHEYTGLSPKEAHGWGWKVVVHPADLGRLLEEWQAILASRRAGEMEVRIRRYDGVYRWFLVRAVPKLDDHGSIVNWFGSNTDIEDRKRAEEALRRAEEKMQNETSVLREDIERSSMFEEIVGSSEPVKQVLRQLAKVAPSDCTVLLLGETGTGKELLARAVHRRSNRATKAFIRVNCAAIPQPLIASELFGHEKGAFTGAVQRRIGRFEAADGGTLFLDEVGDLPHETQIALLRVLQEGEIDRVGSNRAISVNVRIITATNRNLQEAVAAGTFRQDLFYRLNVFPIQVPPLRERAADIPVLVEYFIERYARKAGKKIKHIGRTTLNLFKAYDWPGNIRELQNVVERAVILSDGETFHVDESWLQREAAPVQAQAGPLAALAEREKEMIEAALARCKGRVSGPEGAATLLRVPRQTLESKIVSLGVNKYHFKSRIAEQSAIADR